MSSNTHVDVPAYLQIEPTFWNYANKDRVEAISGAKVARVTQKRSDNPLAGTLEVKVTIRIPKTAFLPLRPEAVIEIPESLTQPHPVEVIAEDPNDE